MFGIQKYGGISRIFIELMRELVKSSELSVDWFRGCHLDAYDVSDFSSQLGRYWSFPRYNIPRANYETINRFGLKLFVASRGKPYDIYHPTYYDAALLDVVKPKKLVVTVHDMILELFLGNLDRFQQQIKDKRSLIEKADLILVNSLSTKKDLLQLIPVDPAKIRLTPWATRIKDVVAEKLPASCESKPYFLYVGTRSKYKNFEILIKAFAVDAWLKSNFNVVCFGGSGDFTEPELRAINEGNLRENFVYVRGGDSLLKALYQNAQALVYTSRYEGFGLPPLEAMVCGSPVICCPTSSLPEVVGEAARFFEADSVDDLVEAMKSVVEDTQLRQVLVAKGSDRASGFSWERCAELTLQAYQDLV